MFAVEPLGTTRPDDWSRAKQGRGEAGLNKRSIVIAGHRTSVSLEPPFWTALQGFARADGVSLNELVAMVDGGRAGNLSSALRVYVLERLLRVAGVDRASG